jgi:hypothetical protein
MDDVAWPSRRDLSGQLTRRVQAEGHDSPSASDLTTTRARLGALVASAQAARSFRTSGPLARPGNDDAVHELWLAEKDAVDRRAQERTRP